MSPNQLFVLFFFGVLCIYTGLFVRFHRILALIGLGSSVAAVSLAPHDPCTPLGLALLASAILLFALEYYWRVGYVAGLAGAVLLPAGFALLYSGRHRIAKPLAIPLGLVLGIATALLCWSGKLARRNKTSDL